MSPLRPTSGAAASTSTPAIPIGGGLRRASRLFTAHTPQGAVRRSSTTIASGDGSTASFTRLWRRRNGETIGQQTTPGVEAVAVVPALLRPTAAAHMLLIPLSGVLCAALAVRAVIAANLASGPSASPPTVVAARVDPDAAKRAALARELATTAARPGGARAARAAGFSTALLSTRASVSLTRAIQAAEFGEMAGAMAELDRALRTHAEARGGVSLPSGAGASDRARLYCLFLQNTELPAEFGSLLALRDLLHISGPDAEALEAEILSSGADFSI